MTFSTVLAGSIFPIQRETERENGKQVAERRCDMVMQGNTREGEHGSNNEIARQHGCPKGFLARKPKPDLLPGVLL